MKEWGRRIRRIIGTGLAWGAAGSFAGFLLARLSSFDVDLPFPLLFAPLGLFCGVIFAGILAATEGRRGFDGTSFPRYVGWGAASGLLLTGIIVAGAAYRGENVWAEFLLFGPGLTVGSVVCAAGSLAVARRAGKQQVAGPR